MRTRKLIFCLLLSVMLTVTFIPSIAFGIDDDEGAEAVPHNIVFGDAENELVPAYDSEGEFWYVSPADGSYGYVYGPSYDEDNETFFGNEGERVEVYTNADAGYQGSEVVAYLIDNSDDEEFDSFELDNDGDECWYFTMPTYEDHPDYRVKIYVGFEEYKPEIDQCGSIVVKDWIMDEEECNIWNSPDGKASVQLTVAEGDHGIYGFDDNYAHAVIGETVSVRIEMTNEEDEDAYRTSATINGEGCYDEEWGEYRFTVAPDTVNGDKRTPGNVLSINCEKVFEDLTDAEMASANKNVINEGDKKTVNTSGDQTVTFKFVAPADGKYAFYSLVDADDYDDEDIGIDPVGRVLDADGNVIEEGKGDQLNFELFFDAEEGQTYYLQATDWGGREVSFTVGLIESDIVGIEYQPKKPWQLRMGIDVYWNTEYDEEGNESRIYYWNTPEIAIGDQLIVTKKGGAKTTYELVDNEDWDDWIFVNVDDPNDILPGWPSIEADEDWAPVEDNPTETSKDVTVSYAGNETTVLVYFVANPFEELEITLPSDGVKVERKDAADAESSPDYYWNWGDTKFVFTKKDNTSGDNTIEYVWDHGGIYNEVEDDWIMLEPQYIDATSGFDEEGNFIYWEAGETHNIPITVAGFEKDIAVTVTGHKHNLDFVEGYESTCDEEGMKNHWRCTICDDLFLDAEGKVKVNDPDELYIPMHNLVKIAAKAATYRAAGNKEYYQCSTCKKYFSDAAGNTEIAANSWILSKLAAKAQTVTVKAATKTVKAKKLKKKALTVKSLTVKGAKGTLSYKVVGGNKKSKKALKVNAKNGKVTVKKKTKKGKYTVKVKVTSAETPSGEFAAFNKTVNVTVKVK